MRRALPFLLFLATSLVFGSCKSKMGDTCSGAAETCADEHTKLVCKHDRFHAIPCGGAKGCKVAGEKAQCDFSGNKPGSPCDDTLVGLRQCRDGKSALGCRDGKFAVQECGGPGGCTSQGTTPDSLVKDCDTTVAKEGGDCDRAYTTKPACSDNGKATLECGKDNKFAFYHHCRGPKGCTSEKGEAVCDGSKQNIGDPCTPPGEWCSDDGVGVLLCDGQKIFEKLCLGAGGCKTAENGVSCDAITPFENSPCDKKGQRACQKAYDKDPPKLLECDGKKFTVAKRCVLECKFTRPSTYECVDKKDK